MTTETVSYQLLFFLSFAHLIKKSALFGSINPLPVTKKINFYLTFIHE